MKKILFRSLAACLLLFGVAACAEPDPLPDPDIPDNPSDNPGGDNLDDNDDKDEPEEPVIDEFEIITEDNGLSLKRKHLNLLMQKKEILIFLLMKLLLIPIIHGAGSQD